RKVAAWRKNFRRLGHRPVDCQFVQRGCNKSQHPVVLQSIEERNSMENSIQACWHVSAALVGTSSKRFTSGFTRICLGNGGVGAGRRSRSDSEYSERNEHSLYRDGRRTEFKIHHVSRRFRFCWMYSGRLDHSWNETSVVECAVDRPRNRT